MNRNGKGAFDPEYSISRIPDKKVADPSNEWLEAYDKEANNEVPDPRP